MHKRYLKKPAKIIRGSWTNVSMLIKNICINHPYYPYSLDNLTRAKLISYVQQEYAHNFPKSNQSIQVEACVATI